MCQYVAPKDNVLILGDSLACGSQGRVKEVKSSNENISWECKVGSSVEFWNAGKAHEAFQKHPQTTSVIVFLGTNNYASSGTPAAGNILKEIKARHLPCVWVGNTAVRGQRWAVNGKLRTAVEPTCKYVDAEASGITLPDGIHPSWSSWLTLLKMIWAVR